MSTASCVIQALQGGGSTRANPNNPFRQQSSDSNPFVSQAQVFGQQAPSAATFQQPAASLSPLTAEGERLRAEEQALLQEMRAVQLAPSTGFGTEVRPASLLRFFPAARRQFGS